MGVLSRYLSAVILAAFFTAFQFAPAAAQTVTRGPYLQLATESSIVIRWRTDIATDSKVSFGATLGALSQSAATGALTTEHEVTLTGLAADARYYYAVGSSSQVLAGGDAGHRFATAPVPGAAKTTRIWVLGDSGTANDNVRLVRDAYKAYTGSRATDLWLMLGDNAYTNGTDDEFQVAVFDMFPEMLRQAPLWPNFGNHDGLPTDAATQTGPYFNMFTLPANGEAGGVPSGTEAYFSFDYGNIHFVNLDSYASDRSVGGAMLTWLEQDLAATDKDWIIAYWHYPPYSQGSQNSDTTARMVEMRRNAGPILEAYGVDLVLSGHNHSYERSHLLDGHYGTSDTLDPDTMILDSGGGREDGAGAYNKPKSARVGHQGTVYAVVGSSGKVGGLGGIHPAMFHATNTLGSMVIDVSGNRLDASFIDRNGTVRDSFTIKKNPDTQPPLLVFASVQDAATVSVIFDEPLDKSLAETVANYAVNNGIAVTDAVLGADDRTVTLTVSTLTEGVPYTLTAGNLADLAGNVIPPDTQTAFSYSTVVTRSFQDGVSPGAPYAGTRDATLSGYEPDTAFGGETVLLVDGDDPLRTGFDTVSLLSWDLSSIPADAVIDAASLTIGVVNVTNSVYEIYGVLRPWTESQATWNAAADGVAWSQAGASGTEDRGSTVLGSVTAGALGNKTVLLNGSGLALIQGWVDGSVPNHGLILADSVAANGLDFASREASSPSSRPKLTVTYSLPAQGSDIEPPAPPSGLTAVDVTPTGVSLSWQSCAAPPCDNVGVEGYKVYRDGALIATTASAAYQDSGLAPETAYGYHVTSFDAAGNESLPSDDPPMTVTTEAEAVPVVHVEDIAMAVDDDGTTVGARARMTILDDKAKPVGGATVTGSWSGVVTEAGAGVTAADGTLTIASSTVAAGSAGSAGEFTFTIGNVGASGAIYDPAVNIETADCISAAGDTCDTEPPHPPAGLTAVDVTPTGVSLSWQGCASPPCDNVGVTGYKVYRNDQMIGTTAATTYQHGGLAPETGYGYHVTSVDAAGNESLPSNAPPLAVTTAAEPPPPVVMQLSGIAVTLKYLSYWRWVGEATVTVVDRATGAPVQGATVTGNWQLESSGGWLSDIGEAIGITGADGTVTIASSSRYAFSGYRFIYTVTGVTRDGDTYEPGTLTSGSAALP